jgi:hypothetical protein
VSQAIQPTTPDTLHGADSERVPALAPPDVINPVIEAYKQDVDRTLIRENLKPEPTSSCGCGLGWGTPRFPATAWVVL